MTSTTFNNHNETDSGCREKIRHTNSNSNQGAHRQDLGISEHHEKQLDAAADELEEVDDHSTTPERVRSEKTDFHVSNELPYYASSQGGVPAAVPFTPGIAPLSAKAETDPEKGLRMSRNGSKPGSSSDDTETLADTPSNFPNASRVSTDREGNVYPEGGREAWLVVFGSWAGLLCALGMIPNSLTSTSTSYSYLLFLQAL